MKRLGKSKINELGSMMVEALAMLGLISMVTPVVYKKAAERNTEMQDVNAAAQLRTLVRAVDEYIQDNYDTIIKGEEVSNGCSVSKINYSGFNNAGENHKLVNIAHLCDYLPYGFLTNAGAVSDNKIFSKDYKFSVKKVDGANNQKALTGFLVAQPKQGNDFSRIRASRISSMIGGNGGFVENGNAFGVQGMWQVDDINGKLGITGVSDGAIITTSAQPISSGKANYDEVLHRFQKNGKPELNRMETTLSMGSAGAQGQNIENVNRVIITAANSAAVGQKESGWQQKALWIQGTSAGAYIDGTFQSAAGKFAVDASSNVKSQGTLGVGGTASDGLTVSTTGNTVAKGTLSAAANNFVVGANGQVSASAGNFTVDAAGNTVAKGTLSAANANFTVDANGNTVVKGDLAANKRVAINGAHDADANYKLTVNGNAIIKGLLRVTNFKADNIDAGTLRAGTNNVANNNRQDYTLYTDSARLVVGATSATDAVGVFNVDRTGFTYAKGLRAGLVNGTIYPFTVGNDANSNINMRLRTASSNIIARNAGDTGDLLNINETNSKLAAVSAGNYSEVYLNNDQASLGVGTATGADRNLTVYKTNSTTTGVARPQVWVRNGTDLKVLNQQGHVILNVDQSGAMKDSVYPSPETTDGKSRGSVYIRKGVIELASRDAGAAGSYNYTSPFVTGADDMGYVKADMLISQQTYTPDANSLPSAYDYFPDDQYDRYQVNPAYTSVMHDIKLTTRGGARLSDILPDFVNKGIYTADNTYSEASIREGALTRVVKDPVTNLDTVVGTVNPPSGASIKVGTPLASAWLGVVPPPQCPPGYEKVVSMVPMSFKMAEAESVWDDKRYGAQTFYHFKDAHEQIPGVANPYFSPREDYKPTPLTFQKNTYLKVMNYSHGEKNSFKGWSVLMGFLYPISDYSETVSPSTGTLVKAKYYEAYGADTLQNNNNNYVWNLYPVYAGTLDALVTVYCFFSRGDGRGFTGTRDKIDTTYDYLNTLKNRTLIDKPAAYKARLNDPKLKYKSEW